MIYLQINRKDNEYIALRYAKNDKLVEEKNGRYDVEFEYPLVHEITFEDGKKEKVHNLFKKFAFIKCDTPRYGQQLFFITDIQKLVKGVKIYAKHIAFLSRKLFVKNFSFNNRSCSQVFDGISSTISDKNNFVFYSDIVDIHTINLENKMLFDVLYDTQHSISTLWQGTFLLDNYNIKYLSRRGKDTEYIIANRKNVSDINIKQDADSVATRLYMRSNKRSDKEEDRDIIFETVVESPLINEYPFVLADYREYTDSFRTQKELEKYGQDLFKVHKIDLPKENFTLVGTDEINSYNLDIDDTCLIYYEDYNIHKRIDVIGYTFSPMEFRYIQVDFGYKLKSLTDTVLNKTEKKIKLSNDLIKGQIEKNVESKIDRKVGENNEKVKEEINKNVESKINESTVILKKLLENIKSNLEAEIEKAKKDLDVETVKSLSKAETEKYIRSKEGQKELIKGITADIVWLKAIVTDTEILNTITANIDIAKIKKLIVDTAFVESIISNEAFQQQFSESEAGTVNNIFQKFKTSILQALKVSIADELKKEVKHYETLLRTSVDEIRGEVSRSINSLENKVDEVEKITSIHSQKFDNIESIVSSVSEIAKNLIKNKTVSVNKNNSFKEVINLEKGKVYNFKFSSKGNCEVYVVFTYKDDKRRYKYKYPKKFIDKRLIGGKYSSTFYSNHILSFKVPEQYKESYIIYKGIEDSEIKDISLGEHIGQYNADRITRLKQDLDGFKLTAENNINKVKSEFNVKADEISSKVKNVENKISTEIAQSTNEIKSTVKEMKEDLKQFKNLCKESTKEINGNDIYFDCEKLLKGQKYKVTFKAKDIQNNAEYKVYNSDMNYRKISENNAWVFTPSQDITQLNLYNGGGSNPKANIYDVQIFKLNDDPRLEELKSEIKQTSTEISLKVSKKDIVSEINQSAESVKIRANKIELDGDVIANKLTSKRLYGNYIDGAVINGGTIKIGNYGFLQPAQNCLQIKVPQTQYATYGIGVQIHGRKATKNIPAGMFIYRDDDFERGNDIGDNVEEILLTVAGRMQACFKFNGQEISGTPVMTNFYKNNPVGGDMYAIRFIGYDPRHKSIYFDDGTGSDGTWWVTPDLSSSDRRLKENIKESNQDCLDLISKINFKSFDWKKDKFGYAKEHTKTGIIADELQELDDSLVYTHTNDDKKTKYIDDFRLLAVTTKAVQELSKKVEELQLKIKQLEER